MHNGKLFFGFLLLTVGLLFLLDNYGVNLRFVTTLLKLWPVLLILIGIALLAQREAVTSLILVLLAILLGSTVYKAAVFPRNRGYEFIPRKASWNGDVKEQNLQLTYNESTTGASLKYSVGAGKFSISDSTSYLAQATTSSSIGDYELTTQRSDTHESVTFKLVDQRIPLFTAGANRNTADLSLNPNTEWTIDMNVGASEGNFDLSAYKVVSVKLSGGASSIDMKLGNRQEMANIDLSVGASSLTLYIPKDSGCEIKYSGGLSSKNFDGFDKVADNKFRTPGYDTTSKKVTVNASAGVSNIQVIRY